MPQVTCRCGSPATAARLYPGTTNRPLCVECAAIDRIQIDPVPERSVPIPEHLTGSRALAIHPHSTVYNHQSVALNLLQEQQCRVLHAHRLGEKLIFMMHALHVTEADPNATAIVFYPAKALANDQRTRWQHAADAAGMALKQSSRSPATRPCATANSFSAGQPLPS